MPSVDRVGNGQPAALRIDARIASVQAAVRRSEDGSRSTGRTVATVHAEAAALRIRIAEQTAAAAGIARAVERTDDNVGSASTSVAAMRGVADQMALNVSVVDARQVEVDAMLGRLREGATAFPLTIAAAG